MTRLQEELLKPVDYKKDFKELYSPKTKPQMVKVPPIRFAMGRGTGDPNEEPFSQLTAALYSFSYAVKMLTKVGMCLRVITNTRCFPWKACGISSTMIKAVLTNQITNTL